MLSGVIQTLGVAASPAAAADDDDDDDDDAEVDWTGRALSGTILMAGVAEGESDLDELNC